MDPVGAGHEPGPVLYGPDPGGGEAGCGVGGGGAFEEGHGDRLDPTLEEALEDVDRSLVWGKPVASEAGDAMLSLDQEVEPGGGLGGDQVGASEVVEDPVDRGSLRDLDLDLVVGPDAEQAPGHPRGGGGGADDQQPGDEGEPAQGDPEPHRRPRSGAPARYSSRSTWAAR